MLNNGQQQRVNKKPASGGAKPPQNRPKRKFELTKKYQVLLVSLLTALARALAVNLAYLEASTLPVNMAGLEYPPHQPNNNSYSLVSRLLLSLCSLASTIKVDSDKPLPHYIDRCHNAIIKAITVGTKIFFPSASYRILLLEALLYKRKQKIRMFDDYNSAGHAAGMPIKTLLKHITPNAYEVNDSTGRMNILADDYPHPLIMVLSISDTMENLLLESLLDYFGNVTNIGLVLHAEIMPTFKESLGTVNSSTTEVTIQVGDYVERGPDWKYGDQDGGYRSYGVVVHISDSWEVGDSIGSTRTNTKNGMCVDVVWFKNSNKNSYRWHVSSPTDDRVINDIQVIRVSPNQRVLSTIGDEDPKYVRRPLLYTPDMVRNALTHNINTDVISKSNIINYIKEIAPTSWQLEHSMLGQNVNALVRKLTSANLISIYEEFYKTFSTSQTANEIGTNELIITSVDKVILQLEHSLMNHNVMHIHTLAYSLVVSGIGGNQAFESVLLRFISVMQGVLTGAVDVTRCDRDVHYAREPKGRLVDKPFRDSQYIHESEHACSENRCYAWKNGMWAKSHDGEVDDDKDKAKLADVDDVSSFINTAGCIALDNLNFDSINMEPSIQVGDDRSVAQCENNMASILGDYPMLPNSGTYTWLTRIHGIGRKRRNRTTIFVGVACQHTSLDNYIGSDEFGWGLSLNGKMYHNDEDIDSVDVEFDVGSIIQLKYDSDGGILYLVRAGEPDTLLFDGIDEETILVPAWTLPNLGDCLSIVPCTNSADKSAKLVKSNTPITTNIIGCPHPLLTGGSFVLSESIKLINKLLASSYLHVLHPIVSVHFSQWLATVALNPVLVIHHVSTVFDELKSLLQTILDLAKKITYAEEECCFELLGQLSVVVCCVLGIMIESKISGRLSTSISNVELARLENKHQQFPEDTGHTLNAQKWLQKRLFSQGFSNTNGAMSNRVIQEIINMPVLRIINEGHLTSNVPLLFKWLVLHASIPTAKNYPYNDNIAKIVVLLFCANIYHSGHLYCLIIVVDKLNSYCKDQGKH